MELHAVKISYLWSTATAYRRKAQQTGQRPMKVKRKTTSLPLRRRQHDLLKQTTQRFARFFHRFALTKAPDQARHPLAVSLRHPRMKPQWRSGGLGPAQARLNGWLRDKEPLTIGQPYYAASDRNRHFASLSYSQRAAYFVFNFGFT
jgi:hypothetical protein